MDDGHRVIEEGDIVFAREAISTLMKQFPDID
jgi:hypothetical protein